MVILAALAVWPCSYTCAAESAAGVTDTMVAAIIVQGRAAVGGPGVSVTGAGDYSATAADIANLPSAGAADLTDMLLQMPGVALDQNQQIHIRDTEGPQFQYQINGALVPLDINSNPPFLSMINPLFIQRLDLIDGVLPSRFSYATGGVVDIETKDGCDGSSGDVSLTAGQRETVQASGQYGGCVGRFGYYVSGLYGQSDTAFSSATPGPDPIHDHGRQGQTFGVFSYRFDDKTQLGLILSAAASNNQLPNVPGLAPQFTLEGAGPLDSASVDSSLDFRDYLAILSLKGALAPNLTYQINYALHAISEDFKPDEAGELIFQGVASRASHRDFDNTLQGDITYTSARNTLSAGLYSGLYHVVAGATSLVFPTDTDGNQTSSVPVAVTIGARSTNLVLGAYVDDTWKATDRLTVDLGLRWDGLTGFTHHAQLDGAVNLAYALDAATDLHAGVARYMQIPGFQGIAPGAPAAFAGTTAAQSPGATNPTTEDDLEWDAGVVRRLGGGLTVSADGFYERTHHYLDTGQFGVVPIFAPFNYGDGYIWGGELALRYRARGLATYANLTLGQNRQQGVATGQFNFDPAELAYIDSHAIVLDHQPLVGMSSGATLDWKGYSISVDALYSSGLRGGFADATRLPQVIQINASVQREWTVAGVGRIRDRVTVLNALDRVNLIRPAEGIGIFQSAYGPRLTILDSISLAF